MLTRAAIAAACAVVGCAGGGPARPPPPNLLAGANDGHAVPTSSATAALPEAGAEPAPQPWPTVVDRSLAAPDGYHLVAEGADGRVLVEVTGMVKAPPRPPWPAGGTENTEYLASFDLEHGCFETTYDFPNLERASATGFVKDALAILNAPEAAAEVASAVSLARAYGASASPYVVTPDGAHVLVVANNELYWSKHGGPFEHVAGGHAGALVLSSDGTKVTFSQNAGGGTYRLVVLDLATGKQRVAGTRNIHEVYAEPSGAFLVTSDDGVGLGRPPTHVCVDRLEPGASTLKSLTCAPSRVLSASISNLSPDGRWLGFLLESRSGDEVQVLDTQNGRELFRAPRPGVYYYVDGAGRVAWDSDSGEVLLAAAGASRPIAAAATAAGFLHDGRLVLGLPAAPRFASEADLRTLGDLQPCGHLRAVAVP